MDNKASDGKEGKEGTIYVIENEAFAKQVVKIGKATDLANRIKALNTGVPLPFTCFKASRVKDMAKVERFLHDTFYPAKGNLRGEFYEVEAWRVAQVLKLFEVEDVTDSAPSPNTDEARSIDKEVKDKEKKSNFTFEMVDIQIGEKLQLVGRLEIECEVVDNKSTVQYEGQPYALSTLATKLKESKWGLQGSRHWSYRDKDIGDETLQQRRERLEDEGKTEDELP